LALNGIGGPGSQKGASSYASHPQTPIARSVQQTPRIMETIPHRASGDQRDGDNALKAGMRESQVRACLRLDAQRPRWGRECLRPRWRWRAAPSAPDWKIGASEATTSTAKIETKTIPTRVSGMKAPVFAQVVRLGCDSQA